MRRVFLYYFCPCQCFVYTRADNCMLYHVPWIMRRHELNRSLRYFFISGSTRSKKSLETGKYSISEGSASMEYFADASSISYITFFCHSQCYFYTACGPTNVGIMFQFSFVFWTFITLFHKAETPLGENFFKQKKTTEAVKLTR